MHILIPSASLYVLLNRFNVYAKAFFLSKAACTFLIVVALHHFRLENGTFSNGSTRVKIIPRQMC